MDELDLRAWTLQPVVVAPLPKPGDGRFIDGVDRLLIPELGDVAPGDTLVLLGLGRLTGAPGDLGIELQAPSSTTVATGRLRTLTPFLASVAAPLQISVALCWASIGSVVSSLARIWPWPLMLNLTQ